jgi:diguanylate cyclase
MLRYLAWCIERHAIQQRFLNGAKYWIPWRKSRAVFVSIDVLCALPYRLRSLHAVTMKKVPSHWLILVQWCCATAQGRSQMSKNTSSNAQWISESVTDASPLQYWNCLFDAVIARLTETVATPSFSGDKVLLDDTMATVLESVDALEKLHAEFALELVRCQAYESHFLASENALARARADLVDTRDGERRAQFLALHDCLTSLPNKSYFLWHIERELTKCKANRQTLALIYVDIDGFKPINDKHGHDFGDELLKVIALRLTQSVRPGDVVSRVGGDEFACLLADSPDRKRLSALASNMLNTVSEPLTVGSHSLEVHASIGIARCPTDGVSSERLLNHADNAMYRAKRQKLGYAFSDLIGT